MILTEEQQRWCAEHMCGLGFDDDDEDKVQYTHVCEFVGGDGDAPRPALAKHMTRKKLVRARRARNAWARALACSSGFTVRNGDTGETLKTSRETAHYWRGRENEAPRFDTTLPSRSPLCDGCYSWIGGHDHSTVFGAYPRRLKYCRACCASGVNDRDYERRAAAWTARKQPLAHEPQRSVALCRSPRLWIGNADAPWPALDTAATVEARAERSKHWANITCENCVRILRERGCP